MKIKINKESVIKTIAGSLFAFASIFFWLMLFNATLSSSGFIMYLLGSLFFSCITLLFILEPLSKYKVFNYLRTGIGWILSTIMLVGSVYQIIVFPLITIVIIIGPQLVIWESLFYFFSIDNSFKIVEAYTIYLLTIIVFAYYGGVITTKLYKFLNNEHSKSQEQLLWFIDKFVSLIFFRRRAYEIGIILSIVSAIDRLLGNPIIPFDAWNTISKVSIEAFITFIAIDTYYINFLKKSEINKINSGESEESANIS